MKMDELQVAIKRTRDYAKKYGQILNKNQLFLRLISANVYNFSHQKKEQKNISIKSEWENKMYLAIDLVDKHLSKMSGIEMVGITGSVAAESVKKDEDIDLMIITKENELWWWRLYLRMYVWWHHIPHRKFKEKENRNEFCFNLWLDRANLIIPHEKRNLKNATDLVIMKVVFDRNNCYQNFLRENNWVKKFLATGYESLLHKNIKKTILKKYWVKTVINTIIFAGQYLYMQSHQKQKLRHIKTGQAFFHEDG